MKICLINPSKVQKHQLCEPLNLLILGTVLKEEGYDVGILDENAHPEQNLWKEIHKFAPDLVGVTATTTLVNDAYKVGDFCRENKIRCVIGGSHASALPEEALTHFDMVIVGEGENALLKIIKDNIQSGIIRGETIKNLDELPIGDRSLIDMEYYSNMVKRFRVFDFLPRKARIAQLVTTRGCPYRCEYCYNSERVTPVRSISPERVVEEIDYLKKDYKVNAIFFQEDEFFINKRRVMKICELLLKKNIKIMWGAFSRAETIDYDTFKLAKKAGCTFLCLGIESGSPRMIKVMNKRTTIKNMSRGIKIANNLGIIVNGLFMVGYPYEIEADLKETERFIMRHRIQEVGVGIYTPFPGTALWMRMLREGKIKYPLDYSKFTFDDVVIHTNDMHVADIHRWRTRILVRGYLQPSRFFDLLLHGLKPHNLKRIYFLLRNAFSSNIASYY